jgi:hypothetical protein
VTVDRLATRSPPAAWSTASRSPACCTRSSPAPSADRTRPARPRVRSRTDPVGRSDREVMTSTIPLPPPPSPRVPPPPGPWTVEAHPPLVATAPDRLVTAGGADGRRRQAWSWRCGAGRAGLRTGGPCSSASPCSRLSSAVPAPPQPVRRPGLRTDVIHLLVSNTLSSAGTIVAVVAWAGAAAGGAQRADGVRHAAAGAAGGGGVRAVRGARLHRPPGAAQVDLFWRFHAVHHSSTRLDWISGARLHPSRVSSPGRSSGRRSS